MAGPVQQWPFPPAADVQSIALWCRQIGDLLTGRLANLGAEGSVRTAQLADDAVTNAKLADMAQATIKGRAAGAGVGDPQDLTADQVNAIVGGSVIIASGSMPSAATLEITDIPDYFSYLIFQLVSVSLDTANRTLRVHGSVDNGSSYDTTNYNIMTLVAGSSPSEPAVGSFIDPAVAALATNSIFATMMFYAYQVDQARHCIADSFTTGGGGARRFLSQLHTAVGAMNALRVSLNDTGNFDTGTYALIGIR